MKSGKLKRYWSRWPGIIILFGFGSLGLWLTSYIVMGIFDLPGMMIPVSACLMIFGFFAGTYQYFKGHVYYMRSRVYLEDCDFFRVVGNDLVVIYGGQVRIYKYIGAAVRKRGYIAIQTEYDRFRKAAAWRILPD